MASGSDVFGGKNSALNVLVEKILIGIGGHFSVGSQIARFGAENKLIARIAFRFQLNKCRANAAFATLKPVIDRRVGDVDSVLDGRDDSSGVGSVSAFVRLAEIGADAQR